MKRLIPIAIAGGILIADLAEPGYGRFGWAKLINPAQETIARARRRSQPVTQSVVQVVGISINGRDKGCQDADKQYQGFNAAQWQRFKKAGKGQEISVMLATLGGAFCQLSDGSLRFLPAFASDKKLDVKVEKGRVRDARFNQI